MNFNLFILFIITSFKSVYKTFLIKISFYLNKKRFKVSNKFEISNEIEL